jgi:hypothetical protein
VPAQWRRRGPPGDRLAERVVDLEGAGAVAVAGEAAAVAGREAIAGDGESWRGADVEQVARAGGSSVERADGEAGDDLAAQVAQVGGQGIGQLLGAAAGHRPADGVGEQAEEEAEGGGAGPVEGQDAVGAETGKKATRALAGKRAWARPRTERRAVRAKRAAMSGMVRRAERAEESDR